MKSEAGKRIEERRKRRKRKQRIITAIVIVLAIVVSVVSWLAYDQHTDKGTMGCRVSVYGIDISKMTAKDAAIEILAHFQETEVTFYEDANEVYRTDLKRLGFALDTEGLAQELSEIQGEREKARGLFEPFLRLRDYEPEYRIVPDEEMQKVEIAAVASAEEKRTPSHEPYVKYDEEKAEYLVVDEVQGNKIDEAMLAKQVSEAVHDTFSVSLADDALEIEIGLEVYEKTPEDERARLDEQMQDLNAELQNCRKTTVTYLFGDETEAIETDLLASWVQASDAGITLDEEAIRSYVGTLAEKYNTIYRMRIFQTTGGTTEYVDGNEYGFEINEGAEVEQLLADLVSGTEIRREPIYSIKGLARNGSDDLAGSYIEVSLGQQHLWLYKDGALVTETDIISGLPKDDRETLKGAWPIAYLSSPFNLTSEEYGYDVEVQYWMPYVYGQGLHDAEWNSVFGGDVYKTGGSHGCINLPPGQAALIYNTISAGYPIIVY